MTRQRTDREVRAWCGSARSLLAEATPLIGHLPIRTRGTIGGSLVHADPAAEYPVVMVAHGGRVDVGRARGGGLVRVAAADFFETYLSTAVGPDEILTDSAACLVCRRAARRRPSWRSSRRHGDFALVAAAAAVEVDGSGRIVSSRIALGGVGPHRSRARPQRRCCAHSSRLPP